MEKQIHEKDNDGVKLSARPAIDTTDTKFFLNRAMRRKFERQSREKIATFKSYIYGQFATNGLAHIKCSTDKEFDTMSAFVDSAGFNYVHKYEKDGYKYIDVLSKAPK